MLEDVLLHRFQVMSLVAHRDSHPLIPLQELLTYEKEGSYLLSSLLLFVVKLSFLDSIESNHSIMPSTNDVLRDAILYKKYLLIYNV